MIKVSRHQFSSAPALLGAAPALILAWLLALSGPAQAATGLPDAFPGSFRGAIVGPAGASDGDFTVVIERTGDGFAMRWPPRREVAFQMTDRPGVFRTGDAPNPITGDIAYWARIDNGSLIVYSMQIDEHGGYDIHNYSYTPADGGLDLVIKRIRGGAGPSEYRGRLEKYGR